MYHPISPTTPSGPAFTTEPFFRYFWFPATRELSQSSRTTSILPSAIAWKLGWFSVTFVTFTLQPSFFSSTYFATYTLELEPAHAFSFSFTSPQAVARAPPPDAAAAE